jgi:hypothetical protein
MAGTVELHNLSEIERAFGRAVLRQVHYEGWPARLGRADGTIRYVAPDGTIQMDKVWVRMSGEGTMAEVVAFSVGVPLIANLAVRVADRQGVLTVIGLDTTGGTGGTGGLPYVVPNHNWQHLRLGPDPVYVDGLQVLVGGAVRPTDPPSMAVTVEPGLYRYEGALRYWPETDSASLASYFQTASSLQHFVVVCLDRATNNLAIVDGADSAPFAAGQPFDLQDIYDVLNGVIPASYHPLAGVRLYFGQTQIMPVDIFADARLWLGEAGGGSSGSANPMMFSQTADKTVGNTTTETTLVTTGRGTVTIGANVLVRGSRLEIRGRGHVSDTGTPTLTLRIYLGATEILDSGAITLPTVSAAGFAFDIDVTCRTAGAGGEVVASGRISYDDGTAAFLVKTTVTSIDTTAAQVVDVTVEWGAASASNTLTAQELALFLWTPDDTAFDPGDPEHFWPQVNYYWPQTNFYWPQSGYYWP